MPIDKFEHDVFLSHNRVDKPWARMLATRLEQENWKDRPLKVFFDEWDIAPGENIPIALEKAIYGSRKILLVITPEAIDSEWVEMERSIATAFDPAGRQLRLIPILLRGSENHLPSLLIPLRCIDFREVGQFEESYEELLYAIREERSPRGGEKQNNGISSKTIKQEFKEYFLKESDHRCSICHTKYDVDLYSSESFTGRRESGSNTLIALCASCQFRAVEEEVPVHQLQSLKNTWTALCRTDKPDEMLVNNVEKAFSQAIQYSLSTSIWDIKRARILCMEILHRYNPFHADARILLEKLLNIEKKIEGELSKQDERFYAPITVFYRLPGWITIQFLPLILIEEFAHAFGSWAVGAVKNAQGKRMPLLRHFRYVEINDLPMSDGILDAIQNGRIVSASYNLSKAQREWYTEVEF